ncbi:MAG: Mrp/NBP35 family ATP-binding protein [Deltaproteobacteria bacterium]|nr:Mrp/NBP35 family ATP-binding protein [Deltaproteobacteria bacterium]
MTEKVQQINPTPDREKEREHQDEEIKSTLGRIRNKVLVMSGKGGVGKSTVAVNLAINLAEKGYKVGLMDVDLHGPSVPRIMGLNATFPGGDKPRPIPYSPNLAVISIEPLLPDKDKSVIWRGPLKIGVIRQFISDIEWDELDYLVIDSPPGTGDEPLTVAQTIPDAMALLVTTPQEVALADVRKSIDFCRQVNMPILGVVENMSGMTCPHCGGHIEFFKTGGGQNMAESFGVTFLGRIPFDPEVVEASEHGRPFSEPYKEMTDAVVARVEI